MVVLLMTLGEAGVGSVVLTQWIHFVLLGEYQSITVENGATPEPVL